MSDARILFYLDLLKDNRKLIDSNILANLLKLYKVKNECGRSRKIRPSRTIKLLAITKIIEGDRDVRRFTRKYRATWFDQ